MTVEATSKSLLPLLQQEAFVLFVLKAKIYIHQKRSFFFLLLFNFSSLQETNALSPKLAAHQDNQCHHFEAQQF